MLLAQPAHEFEQKMYPLLTQIFGEDKGERIWLAGQEVRDDDLRHKFYKTLYGDLKNYDPKKQNFIEMRKQSLTKRPVIDCQQFLEDKFYLGLKGSIYPAVMEEFIEINSGKYVEIVLTGGIGTAKTTLALWSTAYQLYCLSCITNPQLLYGLVESDEILVIFQSITAGLAKALDYGRFRALIEKSPYFQKYFPFNADIQSELQFPNRIIVRPVSGQETAAIGQNVIGGIIDELNYMSVVENSKASVDGGTYDQAIAVYNSIARRRKSRFMDQGKIPGLLCLVSSKRYPGQFTDTKEEEAKNDPTIYVYDKRVWDIKPSSFCGEWFKVFIGDENHKSRILAEDEDISKYDPAMVMAIPVEYKHEFQTDIINALREIAGVSTIARFPFIQTTESIAAAFGAVKSVVNWEEVCLNDNKILISPKRFRNIEEPRFCHLDLSLTGDGTGLAIGHVSKFIPMDRGAGVHEILPVVEFDLLLRIKAPLGGEIEYHRIRALLTKLKEIGLPLKWLTADTFQSVDTIQIMRQHGMFTDYQSVDTTIVPYQMLKSALYDGRVRAPEHKTARKELAALEYDSKKMKVDHPPKGSKDVSDAMAAVLFGLTNRMEIWSRHGISAAAIPQSVKDALKQKKLLEEAQNAGTQGNSGGNAQLL